MFSPSMGTYISIDMYIGGLSFIGLIRVDGGEHTMQVNDALHRDGSIQNAQNLIHAVSMSMYQH